MDAPVYLDRAQVCMRYNLSPSAIYKLQKAGEFPQHVKFAHMPKKAYYVTSELEAWDRARRNKIVTPTTRKAGPGRGHKRNQGEGVAA